MLKSCQVYYTKIDQLPSAELVTSIMERFPPVLKKRLSMYKAERARALSLTGKLLLSHGLKDMGYYEDALQEIYYSGNGRPFFQNLQIDFNISHSKDIIICAIAPQCKVGIDIQHVVKISKRASSFFLHPLEDQDMDNHSKITVWAKKEAIGKVDGNGLGMAFTEIYCPENIYYQGQNTYYIHQLDSHTDYVCCIAFHQKSVDIETKEVDLVQLVKEF